MAGLLRYFNRCTVAPVQIFTVLPLDFTLVGLTINYQQRYIQIVKVLDILYLKVAIARLQKGAEPYIPIAQARGITALSMSHG